MKLLIISPFSELTFDIAWLEINTGIGNFVVQQGHAPIILTLTPNKDITFCLTNGKQESFVIKQGIAEITRTSAMLLLSEDL